MLLSFLTFVPMLMKNKEWRHSPMYQKDLPAEGQENFERQGIGCTSCAEEMGPTVTVSVAVTEMTSMSMAMTVAVPINETGGKGLALVVSRGRASAVSG